MAASDPRSLAMAIRADDLALFDLLEDPLPAVALQGMADREGLVSEVIEFEDHRIALATVDAGVGIEVLDQELSPLAGHALAVRIRARDVARPVRAVVIGAVARAAGSADAVSLEAGLTPRELIGCLQLFAPMAAEV